MTFPRQNGIRDASLVLLKEKGGRISLLRVRFTTKKTMQNLLSSGGKIAFVGAFRPRTRFFLMFYFDCGFYLVPFQQKKIRKSTVETSGVSRIL